MGWGTKSGSTMEWFHAPAEPPWPEVRVMVDSRRGPFNVFHDGDRVESGMLYTTLVRDKDGIEVATGRNMVKGNGMPKGSL